MISMTAWFQYEYGFINIDDEYLYFTNTGNGSEIRAIKEKSGGTSKRVDNNAPKAFLFLFLLFCGLTYLLFILLSATILMLGAMIPCFILCYKVYQYMRNELGPSFLIPQANIQAIILEEDHAHIQYLDHKGLVKEISIEKIGERGQFILNRYQEGLMLNPT